MSWYLTVYQHDRQAIRHISSAARSSIGQGGGVDAGVATWQNWHGRCWQRLGLHTGAYGCLPEAGGRHALVLIQFVHLCIWMR